MILLECPETGERCLVESADGYGGWRVVSDGVPHPPPGEHWHWVEHEGRWRADVAKRVEDENRAAMRDPDALLEIITGLLAEIEVLKTKEN